MQLIEVKRTHQELNFWYKTIGDLGIIAGGAVRSWITLESIRDIDIFIRAGNSNEAEQAFNKLSNIISDNQYQEQFDNPLLRRFVPRTGVDGEPISDITIDLIKPRDDRWMRTFALGAEEIISKFDFSICRAAMVGELTALVDENFEKDVENKILRICNIVCPISTVKRVGKYGKYGYSIKASQVIKLFSEWEDRPEEDKIQLKSLLSRSESGEELSIEETLIMSQMLYVD